MTSDNQNSQMFRFFMLPPMPFLMLTPLPISAPTLMFAEEP
jgi:hypothetical protein